MHSVIKSIPRESRRGQPLIVHGQASRDDRRRKLIKVQVRLLESELPQHNSITIEKILLQGRLD
jgi:hypothetical protein